MRAERVSEALGVVCISLLLAACIVALFDDNLEWSTWILAWSILAGVASLTVGRNRT